MVADPNRRPHGRIVRGPGGYSAFVPAPLPPSIAWDGELVAALSGADRAIGRLAGECWRFPNPEIFIIPFLRREAVLSSRIEGTRTTLEELLVAQAGALVGRASEDLEEVVNYVDALEYGLERLDTLPLSLRLIREIHERLMRSVRGDTATPGEFRRSQNWIGPPGCTLNDASYVPPPADELMGCLDALERFLHYDSLPPLVHAGLAHAQFEAIHPFLDGNGRVGRLLITLLLVEREILPSPLLYLSAYFEASREEYYGHLLAVTQEGAWERWLIYFLRGASGPGGGRDRPYGRNRWFVRKMAGSTGWRPNRATRDGAAPVCRKPLLDRGRYRRRIGCGIHDRPTGHRAIGGGRHRLAVWYGEAQPRLLRAGNA